MELYPLDIVDSLDFQFVRKSISKLSTSPQAQERLMSILPISDRDLLMEELKATDEIVSYLLSDENFPSTQFTEITVTANRLKIKGNVPETKAFAELRSTLLVYQSLYTFIQRKADRFTTLFAKLINTPPNPILPKMIDQVIDERGEVRSNASKELAGIRDRLIKSRAAADRIFARAVKKYRDRGVLAEFDETISENRRVLAIQAAYKGQVNGIFHRSSSKSSIVYIEPAETVEINNELAKLADDELQEIRRILRELSEKLRPYAAEILVVEQKLVYLDFTRAKALFAHREECCLPAISEGKSIDLIEAYNPVLRILNKDKKKDTTPLHLKLNDNLRILVISGPNAGGKSIALKTLGLLNMMLQSGFLVPVHPDSKMSLFSKIYADIGDSQSIENELSTYSSKLQKMKHFLDSSDEDTLLLIDEFGSGSDPELGSSLAQVFLEKLNAFKCYGIFTTHYNDIKALAAKLPGVQNGAMLFDKKNLIPQYVLEVGNPGSSYTFEVAGKSGIPPHIINEAKAKTSKETLEVDKLLVKLQDDKLHLEKKKNQLNSELGKLRKLEGERKSTISKLEEKLEKQSRVNEENDRLLYWGQRFQKLVESWMDQEGKKDKKEVVARFIGILNQRSGETEKEEKKTVSKAQSRRDKQLNQLKEAPVKVGDSVKVIQSGMKGTITEIKRDKYIVTVGANITATLSREQFIPASAQLERQPTVKKRKKSFSKKPPQKTKGSSDKSKS